MNTCVNSMQKRPFLNIYQVYMYDKTWLYDVLAKNQQPRTSHKKIIDIWDTTFSATSPTSNQEIAHSVQQLLFTQTHFTFQRTPIHFGVDVQCLSSDDSRQGTLNQVHVWRFSRCLLQLDKRDRTSLIWDLSALDGENRLGYLRRTHNEKANSATTIHFNITPMQPPLLGITVVVVTLTNRLSAGSMVHWPERFGKI